LLCAKYNYLLSKRHGFDSWSFVVPFRDFECSEKTQLMRSCIYNFGPTLGLGESVQLTEILRRYSLREFVSVRESCRIQWDKRGGILPRSWGMLRIMLSKHAGAFPIKPRPEIGLEEVV